MTDLHELLKDIEGHLEYLDDEIYYNMAKEYNQLKEIDRRLKLLDDVLGIVKNNEWQPLEKYFSIMLATRHYH